MKKNLVISVIVGALVALGVSAVPAQAAELSLIHI